MPGENFDDQENGGAVKGWQLGDLIRRLESPPSLLDTLEP
jgi:hypothetical protein